MTVLSDALNACVKLLLTSLGPFSRWLLAEAQVLVFVPHCRWLTCFLGFAAFRSYHRRLCPHSFGFVVRACPSLCELGKESGHKRGSLGVSKGLVSIKNGVKRFVGE